HVILRTCAATCHFTHPPARGMVFGLNVFSAICFKPRGRPRLVLAHESAIINDVSGHDGCESALKCLGWHRVDPSRKATYNFRGYGSDFRKDMIAAAARAPHCTFPALSPSSTCPNSTLYAPHVTREL